MATNLSSESDKLIFKLYVQTAFFLMEAKNYGSEKMLFDTASGATLGL